MMWRLAVSKDGTFATYECYYVEEAQIRVFHESSRDEYGVLKIWGTLTLEGFKCFFETTFLNVIRMASVRVFDMTRCHLFCGCSSRPHKPSPEPPKLVSRMPERIPVLILEDDTELGQRDASLPKPFWAEAALLPREMSSTEVEAHFGPSVGYRITDPRIMLLVCYATLVRDNVLWGRLAGSIPSYEESRAILAKYGLARTIFSNSGGIEQMRLMHNRFLCDVLMEHCPEKREIIEASNAALPEIESEKIKVAGVFAIPHREQVLSALRERKPIRLVREPKNVYDKNAIRVEMKVDHAYCKLGYLPKEVAEEWAPVMDAGRHLHARVAEGRYAEKIRLSMICRNEEREVDEVTAAWGDIDDKWHTVKVDVAKRTVSYCQKDDYYSTSAKEVEMSFVPVIWASIAPLALRKCSFNEWKPAYRRPNNQYKKMLWKLTARYGEEVYSSCGCDCVPIEWETWMEFIELCLELQDRETKKAFVGSLTFKPENLTP